MKETEDNNQAINQGIPATKYEETRNCSNILTEQDFRQDENNTSREKTFIDENFTAQYWG